MILVSNGPTFNFVQPFKTDIKVPFDLVYKSILLRTTIEPSAADTTNMMIYVTDVELETIAELVGL